MSNNELAFPDRLGGKWFSSITIINLKVLLSGCIEYCKRVSKDPSINHDIVYLSMLAFNHSYLESQFSHLCRMNMEKTQTYGAFVNRMSECTAKNSSSGIIDVITKMILRKLQLYRPYLLVEKQ